MLSVEQLKSTANAKKLTDFWQGQLRLNLDQILLNRNATLSSGDYEFVKKAPLRTNPLMVEIVLRGSKCDALLEIWSFQIISRTYGDNDLFKNQTNTGRYQTNKSALSWISKLLPCWSENISQIKKHEPQKLFEAKLRVYNRNETERPKLGIYECNIENCAACVAKGRKCTLSSKGLHPPMINTSDVDYSEYFSNYAKNSSGEIKHFRVGEIKGETGHYRVEVVYLSDKLHSEMISAATTKVTFANSQKTKNIIINDYSPDRTRPRATITHSPSPSTSPLKIGEHVKNAGIRTSPLPLNNNNTLKPNIYSDHGKSAPVNINGEQGYSNGFSLPKEVNSPKYSFSFDKEVTELLATSPQSSISQQFDAPLWRRQEAKSTDDDPPSSPRKFEKRKSGRRKSSSGKSSVLSSGDENQFVFDSETPKKNIERASLLCDPDFENI
jgi:hypothetical protein